MPSPGQPPAPKDAAEIQAWLIRQIADLTGAAPDTIDPRESFDTFGLSSREAVMLSGDLETWLGRDLSPTLVYEYPTIARLAEFLAGSPRPAESASLSAAVRPALTGRGDEIAVIGLACRFPGAASPDAFWRLLRDGGDAITEVPPDRWDADAYFDPNPDTPGKMVTRWGGFLTEVDRFDASFFGIAPREAANLDPQQRLLLEAAWEALEHAGQRAADLTGSPTGVFIGISNSDYATLFHDQAGERGLNAYIGTGTAFSVAAGRLSYLLGLQGPCLAVDTACSSSLVAVHLAIQSLRRGESRMALAGGVNLILSPAGTVYFSRLHAMARDGRCKTFDAAADGYVRADGCGVVVLKRLADALADGDRILAVIRGSAVNQDGRSNGLTAPNGLAQQAVIRSALADAGVAPDQITYVETHGTGTELGDPIEVQALAAVLGEGRPPDRPVLLGAVKANLGHTEAAAGVAGLIKVILTLQHGEIPPQPHIRQLNPLIPWDRLPVSVPTARRPWPADGPRLAGLSSFGFSGTNAHLILEAAPVQPQPGAAPEAVRVLPLSARSPQALKEMAARFQTLLGSPAAPALPDLTYTAAVRRSHHDHRLAVVGATPDEMAQKLAAYLRGETTPGLAAGHSAAGRAPRVVFVFPGQGGQWVGMGRELLRREPVFREVIEQCDAALRRYVDWSLLEVLTSEAASARLTDEIDVIQPALFAIQAGLAALWRAWGVAPTAVVGHSLGEVAAAYVAGALSLDDAAHVISLRSRLMRRTAGRGAMAVVGLTLDEAERLAAGYAGRLSAAVSNGPRSTVLSGDPAALEEVLAALAARDVFCRKVKVDVASHSPHMDPLQPELVSGLAGLQPRAGSIPLYSTVTNAVTDGHDLDADYWGRNLRQPVRFWPALRQLIESGHALFIELSPHPALVSAIRDGLAELKRDGAVLASLRRAEPEQAALLASLGALYTLGAPVNWSALNPAGRVVDLPPYPWQRERYWLEASAVHRQTPDDGAHPLLGLHLRPAIEAGAHFWETELSLARLPYLSDHRVQGAAVLPAAAYLEMALAAAGQAFPDQAVTIEDFAFERSLFLPEDGVRIVQVLLTPQPGGARCRILSRDSQSAEGPWIEHAGGQLRAAPAATDCMNLALIQERCAETVAVAAYYDALAAAGLSYGPAFRGVGYLWRREGEALGALRLPETLAREAGRYGWHPALLDAGLQVLAAALPADRTASGEAWVPVRAAHFRAGPRPGNGRLWSHAVFHETGEAGALTGDVHLLDDDGRVVAEVLGLRVQRLAPARPVPIEDWFLRLVWEARPAPPPPDPAALAGNWLIVAGAEDARVLSARLAAHGGRVIRAVPGAQYAVHTPEHYEFDPADAGHFPRLLTDRFGAGRAALRGIVSLPVPEDAPEKPAVAGLLHLIQALAQARWETAPRLWLITRGAQAVAEGESPDPAAAALWGLARTLLHEHPEFHPALIDMSANREADWAALLAELAAGGDENQIALRDGRRYAARLTPHKIGTPAPPARRFFQPQTDHNFRLEVTEAGLLENLTLRAAERRPPGPGQVEIEVIAAGLNFLDVLSALGLRPDLPPGPIRLGGECAGRVVAVGEGVATVRPGDEVVAIAPASFAAYTTTLAALTAPKPAALSWEQAAAAPIAFLTADYALNQLARLEAGERVLIHAAAGGVGLAALQIARRAGAEVLATAGSAEKRDYLRGLGAAHVLDSRSLAFADEALALTDGEGVDVVLNSLAGDAIARGLAILRPYGRFVEIGKRDIYADHPIGLGPFRRNLAYFAFDLARLAAERPEVVGRRLSALMRQLASGDLQPLPLTVFPLTQAEAAFRHMAQSRHIGKIVLSVTTEAEIEPAAADPAALRADGTYLITGGLGGLGLKLAEWLVQRGARHLALIARRAPSPAAQTRVDRLRAAGAEVRVIAADVAQAAQIAQVLGDLAQTAPPLRGVFHAAGVLDDGILLQLDLARFQAVLAPKVLGAWNLHTLTRDAPLDHFVLFSSAAALLGSPGQANYAAGNAFMDALAHRRRASGLPALSINWGPWTEVGLAARPDRAGRLGLHGLDPIRPDQGFEALAQLLRQSSPQVAALPLHPDQWQRAYPEAARWPLFERLMQATPATAAKPAGVRAEVLAAPPGQQRRARIAAYVQEQLAQVLGLAGARPDETAPLASLGLDSLMAVELKNRVETALGVPLPIASLLRSPTVGEVVDELAGQLTPSPQTPAGDAAAAPATIAPAAEAPLTAEGWREYSLSHGQRALWLQHHIAPGSVYNPVYAVRIRAEVDEAALRRAAQALVDRHPALRTTFGARAGEPHQKVHEHAEAAFRHEAAAGWSQEDLEARLRREAEYVYDLEHGPLLRCLLFTLAPREHVFMLAAHHLVVDLWSLAILINQLGRLYADPAAALPAPGLRYTDFVHWQAGLLASAEGERLWEYWRSRLAGAVTPLDLPADRPRPPVQTFRGAWHALQLGPTLTQKLKRLGEQHGATLYMTLLAAFQVLLHRYTGQTDLIVGTPTTGRSRPEFADVVGYFVNSVALRTDLSGQPGFTALLARVRQTVAEALAHQDYPLNLLVEKLQPQRDASRPPLFQTMFVFERSHLLEEDGFSSLALGTGGQSLQLAGLPLESLPIDNPATPFDLTVVMAESDRGLGASFNYNADLFEPATIARMAGHFAALLEGIVAEPDRPISTLPMLTAAERRQILVDWNATDAPFDLDRPAPRLIEAQAARAPEAVAVSLGAETLTYAELNGRANQLAHHLRARGVRPDTLVGVCVEPSLEMVVAVLGVLKAGGAYLPLDPRYPPDRLAFMLQDSDTRLILTQERLKSQIQSPKAQVLCLDTDWPQIAPSPTVNLQPQTTPDSLAYVIYTSGSTGQPKGALLHHRGLTNLTHVLLDRFALTPASRVLQFASLSFDASVSEIVATLAAGARLVLAPRETLRAPDDLLALLRREAITCVTLPPSLLSVLNPEALPALETVISAGEACTWEIAERWRAGRRFLNGYGPTETTVAASYYQVGERAPGTQTVPIGRPNPNVRFYVLDAQRQPVPIGVPGELYIGGVQVGRGYLNRPELTAERFLRVDTGQWSVTSRPAPRLTDPSTLTTLYKTGDLVRWLPSGDLEFLGRLDDQVKVRGFRIELGEIEAALQKHPAVRQAVVVARGEGGDKRLAAYVVVTDDRRPTTDGGEPTDDRQPPSAVIPELRDFLRGRLPDYMLPSTLTVLDALPLTPNGKVDRQALARLRPARAESGSDFVQPQNDLERRIAEVWQSVLGVERVGVNDNFFDLGGHSLLVVKVQAELQQRLGRELPIVDLFQFPTVSALAQHLSRAGDGPGAAQAGQARAEKQKAALAQQQQRLRAAAAARRPAGPPTNGRGTG